MSAAEEWRPIPGFDGYEVSSVGRVRSHKRGTPRVLRTNPSYNGYQQLVLTTAGRSFKRKVHRLVALAFIGPCPEGMEVRHLDGDKNHNVPSNLIYGTRSENIFDQVRHGVHNNARKTECSQQHSLTDESNVYRWRGRRKCRTCLRQSRSRHALRAANVSERAA